MPRFFKRHESKLFWGGLIFSLLYIYFLFDVECAYISRNCPISDGSLANTVFTIVGLK